MTAKEKAEKLVQRMQAQRYMSLGAATQCALICVDEIIESNPMEEFGCSDSGTEYRSTDEFWEEVKQEINKL